MILLRDRESGLMKINPFFFMLSTEQQSAFETLSAWLTDSGNLCASLKGFAGTGKTYLTSHIVRVARTLTVRKLNKNGEEEDLPFAICVSATTHQAKKVIHKATSLPARTIQSLVGLSLNTDLENFDINSPEFSIQRDPSMPKYDLVIIDEASQLNSSLKDLVLSTSAAHGVKVLFVYDSGQLEPVGEDFIPVDEASEILIRSVLTEVMRTSGANPILDTFTKIRNDLKSLTDRFEHVTRVSEDRTEGEVYIRSRADFQAYAIRKLWIAFKEKKLYNFKILAWTNKAIQQWNALVRASILNVTKQTDPLSQVIMEGEVLVSYSTVQESIITTSEEYVLETPKIETISLKYFTRDSNLICKEEPEFIDVDFVVGKLVTYDGAIPKSQEVKIVFPSDENIVKFLKVFKWYHSLGTIDKKWPAFYSWKDEHLLLRDIVRKNGTKICKKDFDYAYAVTIHKSQGTSYDNVYIDETDIDKLEDYNFNKFMYEKTLKEKKTKFAKAKFLQSYPSVEVFYKKNQEVKNRLKYVAMSRPRKFMVMLTNK